VLESGWRWRRVKKLRTLLVIATVWALLFSGCAAQAQNELSRKARTKVAPTYPNIARRLDITGTVRVQVVVSPSGDIENSTVVGGHPLLVKAAMDALKKWKFEPAPESSTGVVEFKFEPQ
jgi:TonB family protein